MLERCVARKCNLITYKDACFERSDCSESVMLVSQVSQAFDWSVHSVAGLSLTSVSADPDATNKSSSRLIARIAHFLNSRGLGMVCDYAIKLNITIRSILAQWFFNGKIFPNSSS